EILSMPEIGSLKNITIAGVMGMATFTDDTAIIKTEFEQLAKIFQVLKQKYFGESSQFCELSMGMSDDYPIAISAGSTMVRIGSKIFGSR
ncbi:MAG: YggS family pyridoxal phosphate-dependent enzyme, partial [Bacteroidota bacterium]